MRWSRWRTGWLAHCLRVKSGGWVLDEPTVSLDADAVSLFADAVRAHLAGGGMALIATHIDLGLEAAVLDVTPYRVVLDAARLGASDEAFL